MVIEEPELCIYTDEIATVTTQIAVLLQDFTVIIEDKRYLNIKGNNKSEVQFFFNRGGKL